MVPKTQCPAPHHSPLSIPYTCCVSNFSKSIWTLLFHASFPLGLPWECGVRKWGHLINLLPFTFFLLDSSSWHPKGLSYIAGTFLMPNPCPIYTLTYCKNSLVFRAWLFFWLCVQYLEVTGLGVKSTQQWKYQILNLLSYQGTPGLGFYKLLFFSAKLGSSKDHKC